MCRLLSEKTTQISWPTQYFDFTFAEIKSPVTISPQTKELSTLLGKFNLLLRNINYAINFKTKSSHKSQRPISHQFKKYFGPVSYGAGCYIKKKIYEVKGIGGTW